MPKRTLSTSTVMEAEDAVCVSPAGAILDVESTAASTLRAVNPEAPANIIEKKIPSRARENTIFNWDAFNEYNKDVIIIIVLMRLLNWGYPNSLLYYLAYVHV